MSHCPLLLQDATGSSNRTPFSRTSSCVYSNCFFFFNAIIGLWLYFHQPSQHLQISFPSPTRRSGSQWIPYMVKPICNNKGITQRWGKKTSNFKRMQAMVCSVQPGRHGEQEASSGSLDPQNLFNSNGVRELQVNAGGLAFPSTIYIPQDCFAILTLWPSGALIFISYCGDLKKIIYFFFSLFHSHPSTQTPWQNHSAGWIGNDVIHLRAFSNTNPLWYPPFLLEGEKNREKWRSQ